MHLDETSMKIISIPPDRPNIFLRTIKQKSYDMEEDLRWVIDGLSHEKEHFPKTVIFAPTISQVSDIYEYMSSTLGWDAYCGDPPALDNRLVSMFHGHISDHLHTFTLGAFKEKDCKLRVVISTIAFGMGV